MTGPGGRLLFAAVIAVAAAGLIRYNRSREDKRRPLMLRGYAYTSVLGLQMLPFYLVFRFLLSSAFNRALNWQGAFMEVMMIAAHVAVFDAVMLLLLPLLRRRISAAVCAALWFLPNVLHLRLLPYTSNGPLFLLRMSERTARTAALVWLAGFAAVMLWRTAEHLRFRRRLIRGAVPVPKQVSALWRASLAQLGEDRVRGLVVTPVIASPLTAGLFSHVMALPDRAYTEEELRLIFLHELVHVQRRDSGKKFFMAFFTALCWFDPLVWIAMRRAGEDTELGCDETVLQGTDAETRRKYADLLLKTAGDGRGFTTCLSASASGLRYRLRQVMAPGKKAAGAVVAAVLVFALVLSYGVWCPTVEQGRLGDRYFTGADPVSFRSITVSDRDTGAVSQGSCADEAALREYLAGLPLCLSAGSLSLHGDCVTITCRFGSGRTAILTLCRNAILIEEIEKTYSRGAWYHGGDLDLDYVMSLIKT